MTKRLGIFLITIIASFFIFGSGVLAGSCNIQVENINNAAIRVYGNGVEDHTNLVLILYKQGQAESVGSANVVATNGSFDVTTNINLSSGDYSATIVAAGQTLCSANFSWGGTVDIPDGTVTEGGVCIETKDCVSSPPMICVERNLGAQGTETICQWSETNTGTYLPEGAVCDPNATQIEDTCDQGGGVSCRKVIVGQGEITQGIYYPIYDYRCARSSANNLASSTTPFGKDSNPLDLPDLIRAIVTFSIGIAGVAAFALLSFGAYKYMMSGADPQKIEEAQQTISSAIAGLVLIILAVSLFGIMSGILGIPGVGFDVTGGQAPTLSIPGGFER